MSRVAEFLSDAEGIRHDIRNRTEEVLLYHRDIYRSVVCIQRWVRGHCTRVHLQRSREAAIRIQSYWRLYTTLLELVITVQTKYEEMCIQHYNKMATKIQAYWRGYLVRKKIADFSKRKSMLEACKKANEEMRETLKKLREEQLKEKEKQMELAAEIWTKYILHKLHHLVRTKSTAGVLSIKNSSDLSEVESMLKSIKHQEFMSSLNKAKMEYIEKIYKEAAEKHLGFPKFMDLSMVPSTMTAPEKIEKSTSLPPCVQFSKNFRRQIVPYCGAKELDDCCPFDRKLCECCEDNLQKADKRFIKQKVRNKMGSLYSAMNKPPHPSKPIVLANYRTKTIPLLSQQMEQGIKEEKTFEPVSECQDDRSSDDQSKVTSKNVSQQSDPSSKSSKWKRIKSSSPAEGKSSQKRMSLGSSEEKSKKDSTGGKVRILEPAKVHSNRTGSYSRSPTLGSPSAHASKQWVVNRKTLSCVSSCPSK